MTIMFNDVARELKMASNQIEAIKNILCITKDTYVDLRTLKLFAADFPQNLRDWVYINNPEGIYFTGVPKNWDDNDYRDYEHLYIE